MIPNKIFNVYASLIHPFPSPTRAMNSLFKILNKYIIIKCWLQKYHQNHLLIGQSWIYSYCSERARTLRFILVSEWDVQSQDIYEILNFSLWWVFQFGGLIVKQSKDHGLIVQDDGQGKVNQVVKDVLGYKHLMLSIEELMILSGSTWDE